MSFSKHLKDVCQGLDGAVACSLVGLDGIEVETYLAEGLAGGDLKSLMVEYSGLVRAAREAARAHGGGELAELAVGSDELVIVARLVSPDYVIILAFRPEGNYGKARYLLRIAAPQVRAEL
jgi:predicted regulator of Ras-like GTPase activity (Roadblock/LC7/MglB family)